MSDSTDQSLKQIRGADENNAYGKAENTQASQFVADFTVAKEQAAEHLHALRVSLEGAFETASRTSPTMIAQEHIIADLKAQVKAMQAEILAATVNLDRCRSQLEDCQIEVGILSKSNGAFEAKLRGKAAETSQMQRDTAAQAGALATMKEHLARLETENATLRADNARLRSSLLTNDSGLEVDELNIKIRRLQTENTRLQTSLTSALSSDEKLKQSYRCTHELNNQLMDENGALSRQVQQLQQQIDDLHEDAILQSRKMKRLEQVPASNGSPAPVAPTTQTPAPNALPTTQLPSSASIGSETGVGTGSVAKGASGAIPTVHTESASSSLSAATAAPPTQTTAVTVNPTEPCAAQEAPGVQVVSVSALQSEEGKLKLGGGTGTLSDCDEESESGDEEEGETSDVSADGNRIICNDIEEPCAVAEAAALRAAAVPAAASASAPRSVTISSARPSEVTKFSITLSSAPTPAPLSTSQSQRNSITTTTAAARSIPLSPTPAERKTVRTVEVAARPPATSIVLQDTHCRNTDANKVNSNTALHTVVADTAPYSNSLSDALFYKVLISNVLYRTPASAIREIAERCGPVVMFNELPSCISYVVEYTTAEGARRAVHELDDFLLDGSRIRCKRYAEPKPWAEIATAATRMLCIKYGGTIEDVRRRVERYGKVGKISYKNGAYLVECESHNHAACAVNQLHNLWVDGKQFDCTLHWPKPTSNASTLTAPVPAAAPPLPSTRPPAPRQTVILSDPALSAKSPTKRTISETRTANDGCDHCREAGRFGARYSHYTEECRFPRKPVRADPAPVPSRIYSTSSSAGSSISGGHNARSSEQVVSVVGLKKGVSGGVREGDATAATVAPVVTLTDSIVRPLSSRR